ncbi:MAG: hypothetical protein RL701_8186, partial [Pseudomonadota bacterium]
MMNQPLKRLDPLGRSASLSTARPNWPWAPTPTGGSVLPIRGGSERAIVDNMGSVHRLRCCSLTPSDCEKAGAASCLAAVNVLPTYGMQFDGTTAQQCLDATRVLYLHCGYADGMQPEYLAQAAASRALTAGTILPGGACQYDNSCRHDSG